MANLAKDYGLELPVYGPETILVSTKYDMYNASQNTDQSTLIRKVKFRVPGQHSLKGALAEADSHLEAAAQRVGAAVVRHQWGLYQHDAYSPYFRYAGEEDNYDGAKPPEGHIVVAEVDVIRSIEHITFAQDSRIRLEKFGNQMMRHFHLHNRWADWSVEQFANGVAPGEDQRKLWLLDIDPVLTD